MNDLLKNTFNEQAELYNEVRPRYPEELFDTLVKTTALSKDAQLLEIGAGTGQATKPLAQKGYNITAVELGDEMATIARRELAEFNSVKVITSSFEEVALPENSFDLIFCATAFHWINPEVKFTKTHALLKDEGYLAIIYTLYVSDESHDVFFKEAHNIFEKHDKNKTVVNGKSPILPSDEVKEIPLDTELFEPVLFKTFPEVLQYTIDDYIKLICTFSFIIAMDPIDKENFLKETRDLANKEYDGMVTINLVMSLTLGRKIAK
ncbi:MAG: methyltransferase domain-containing protein [Candidatus Paceibacterota bacterium]